MRRLAFLAASLLCFASPALAAPPPAELAAARAEAAKGSLDAMVRLGFLLERHDPDAKAHREAWTWFEKADRAGSADAAFCLASMVMFGRGRTANERDAIRRYRIAAERGHLQAQRHMKAACQDGLCGLDANPLAAYAWALRAAHQGHAEAQCEVGTALVNGDVLPPDREAGYFWLLLADRAGVKEAADELLLLRGRLTPERRRAIEARVEAWRPRRE